MYILKSVVGFLFVFVLQALAILLGGVEMQIRYFKKDRDEQAVAEADAEVRAAVETILAEIEKYSCIAVRERSERFDG